jgi:hypothetical protein
MIIRHSARPIQLLQPIDAFRTAFCRMIVFSLIFGVIALFAYFLSTLPKNNTVAVVVLALFTATLAFLFNHIPFSMRRDHNNDSFSEPQPPPRPDIDLKQDVADIAKLAFLPYAIGSTIESLKPKNTVEIFLHIDNSKSRPNKLRKLVGKQRKIADISNYLLKLPEDIDAILSDNKQKPESIYLKFINTLGYAEHRLSELYSLHATSTIAKSKIKKKNEMTFIDTTQVFQNANLSIANLKKASLKLMHDSFDTIDANPMYNQLIAREVEVLSTRLHAIAFYANYMNDSIQ